ncbi:hypothetical protein BS17DRAFT_776965 [Gyrodon lividus]|nr:hypothetical protein BS17DRAFT_776965 [Gyrodon lividus]
MLDAPPSYEMTTSRNTSHLANDKSEHQPPVASGSNAPSNTLLIHPRTSQPSSSSWMSMSYFRRSRTSKQVRQTVLSLVRAFVIKPGSPNILHSCAQACKTHNLDFSALLQERAIGGHTAMYWVIVNRRECLLPSFAKYLTFTTHANISDIRLACLVTSNQKLFQALRCCRAPFTRLPPPDLLVLGSTSPADVSVDELHLPDGNSAFVVEMQINMWQKRMRVSGRVNLEFLATGRIWSLDFYSQPVVSGSTSIGAWRVALCLLEHSPSTFIDSMLCVRALPKPPPSSSVPTDLISLSTPSSQPEASTASSSAEVVEMGPRRFHFKSTHRLAYRPSVAHVDHLNTGFSKTATGTQSGNFPSRWSEGGVSYTNAVEVPFEGACAQLMYDNTPFIAADGTLVARLEARLQKPGEAWVDLNI